MKLTRILAGLLKTPSEPTFSKVALAPITDLPQPPRRAVNPLLLQGLYRD
jgi:hypothetical protein